MEKLNSKLVRHNLSNIDITIPSVGESISEATIAQWNYSDGDWVEKDSVLFELETEKASVEVNSPATGQLKISVGDGETIAIGAVVGTLNPDGEKSESKSIPPKPAAPAVQTNVSGAFEPGVGPAARKAIREGKVSPAHIQKQAPSERGSSAGERRQKMSTIRKKIAERLLNSQQSTATLTTFNEVDMSHVLAIRSKLKLSFQEEHGVKLGFMSFFTKACTFAATEVQSVNARLDKTDIIFNDHVHVSVAVSTDRGLVVPVLRFADQLTFAQIEQGIGHLADKARAGKLGIDEMVGGTFTITNGGVFGSLVSTPIINPPQSAILGLHKIQHRPIAIPDSQGNFGVQVRPMMYLALSYDHRLVDGKESVTFLVKVKEYMESIVSEDDVKLQ